MRLVHIGALGAISEPDVASSEVLRYLHSFGLFESLEDRERQYFYGKRSAEDRRILAWYAEPLYALAWCARLVRQLPFPDRHSTARETASIVEQMPPNVDPPEFVDRLRLRPLEEIVYQAETYYQIHWALVDQSDLTAARLPVVTERRRALEWVIGREDWDEISLDT